MCIQITAFTTVATHSRISYQLTNREQKRERENKSAGLPLAHHHHHAATTRRIVDATSAGAIRIGAWAEENGNQLDAERYIDTQLEANVHDSSCLGT